MADNLKHTPISSVPSAPTQCVCPAWACINGVQVPCRRTNVQMINSTIRATITTSQEQRQTREEMSGGSWRQSCELTDRNAIEGRDPQDELAQHNEILWFTGHGKWCYTLVPARRTIGPNLEGQRGVAKLDMVMNPTGGARVVGA